MAMGLGFSEILLFALLSGGMTVYILLALPLEERELIRKFGPAYEAYRRQVPALIPWRIPCRF